MNEPLFYVHLRYPADGETPETFGEAVPVMSLHWGMDYQIIRAYLLVAMPDEGLQVIKADGHMRCTDPESACAYCEGTAG